MAGSPLATMPSPPSSAGPVSQSPLSAPSSSHQIVRRLWQALRALGVSASPAQVEAWGLAVHCALSSTARQFHSHEHVIELAEGAEPLDVIAALYHDVVYVQVDGQLPSSMARELDPLLERTNDPSLTASFRIRPVPGGDRIVHDVLAVFGRKPGDALGPMCGLNELASALALGQQLGAVLEREHLIAIAAAIEATIPFREDPGAQLATRLRAMDLPEDEVVWITQRAVVFANTDVANFADPDPAAFLSNTWKLLPETNPSLNVPARYTVGDYRIALLKMETFLERLQAERVFHHWNGAPHPADYQRLVNNAARNIAIGVRYLRAKLLAIGLIEAICVATGGDLPLQYVLGTMARAGEKSALEHYLPPPNNEHTTATGIGTDKTLLKLLQGGRATPSSFDIAPSPLAAHLLVALGEPAIARATADARAFWAGQMTVMEFLARQDAPLVCSLARAAAELAETRKEALLELAEQLGSRTSGTYSR